MPIKFKCACGTMYTVKDELAGKSGTCKQCGNRFTIPYPEGTSPGMPSPAAPSPPSSPSTSTKTAYINYICTCGKEYTLDSKMAGKKGKCSACNQIFTIPSQTVMTPQAQKQTPSAQFAFPPLTLKEEPLSFKEEPPLAFKEEPLSFKEEPPLALKEKKDSLAFKEEKDSLSFKEEKDSLSFKEDLSSLSFKEESEKKECPQCKNSLEKESVICIKCGYDFRTGKTHEGAGPAGVAKTGKKSPTKKFGVSISDIQVTENIGYGSKNKIVEDMSELTVKDFILAVNSKKTVDAIMYMLFAYIGYVVLFLGGFFVLFLFFFGNNPSIGKLIGLIATIIILGIFCGGGIFKYAFAYCESVCHSWPRPDLENWSNWKAGGMLSIITLICYVLIFIISLLLSKTTNGFMVASVLLMMFLFSPVAFLSVSEAHGNFSGLNPARVFKWMFLLFLPYMGVCLLIAIDAIIIAGVSFIVNSIISFGGPFLAFFPMLLLGALGAVHPIAYQSVLLGMLYRKYQNKLNQPVSAATMSLPVAAMVVVVFSLAGFIDWGINKLINRVAQRTFSKPVTWNKYENIKINTEYTAIDLSDKEAFDKEVLQYKGVALVQFWSSSYPPVIDNIAKKYRNIVKVCKVKLDTINPFYISQYQIKQLPYLLYFKDGKDVEGEYGELSQSTIENTIGRMTGVNLPATSIKLTEATFTNEVLEYKGFVLVDFWAPWCGPCRTLAPTIESITRKYKGRIKVGKVNTDENKTFSKIYNITGIPCLIFFKDGKEVSRIVGAYPQQAIEQKIEEILK